MSPNVFQRQTGVFDKRNRNERTSRYVEPKKATRSDEPAPEEQPQTHELPTQAWRPPCLESVAHRTDRSHLNRNNERNIFQRTSCRPGRRTNSTSGRQADFSHGRDESFYQSALDLRFKNLPKFGGVTTPPTPPTFARCTIFYKHFGGGISDPVLK